MDSEFRTGEALQDPDIPGFVSGELGPEIHVDYVNVRFPYRVHL